MTNQGMAQRCSAHSFTNSDRHLEEILHVGASIFLDLSPHDSENNRHRLSIRGWQRGSLLLLEKPDNRGLLVVRRQQQCAVRFIVEGEVWGFYSTVLRDAPDKDGRLMEISWPKDVSRVRVRRHERVEVNIPCLCSFGTDGAIRGTIVDMSAGGCGIQCKQAVDESYREGSRFSLSFRLPDGAMVQHLACVVRNRRPGGIGILFGTEYESLEQGEQFGIGLFVARTLAQNRGQTPEHPCVFVLSDRVEDVTATQIVLGKSGFEVLAISGVLDLGRQLHQRMPRAILISATQKEFPAWEVSRLIKQTPAFSSVPVVVYGGNEDDLQERVQTIGAAIYLQRLSSVGELNAVFGG